MYSRKTMKSALETMISEKQGEMDDLDEELKEGNN